MVTAIDRDDLARAAAAGMSTRRIARELAERGVKVHPSTIGRQLAARRRTEARHALRAKLADLCATLSDLGAEVAEQAEALAGDGADPWARLRLAEAKLGRARDALLVELAKALTLSEHATYAPATDGKAWAPGAADRPFVSRTPSASVGP